MLMRLEPPKMTNAVMTTRTMPESNRCAVGGVIGNVVLKRACHVEGLQAVKAVCIADDEQNGEQHTNPALTERLLDVVCGTAAELALFATHLPHLRECGFDKRRRGARQGHNPHPEHGTRTARGNRRGDTGDIARTDAGSGRNHERLERRNGPLAFYVPFLRKLGEHILDVADLYALRADGEINSRRRQAGTPGCRCT